DRGLVRIEENLRREVVHPDDEVLRIDGACGVDQLARSLAAAAQRGERREADAFEFRRARVVRILRQQLRERTSADAFLPRAEDRGEDRLQQRVVAEDE